MYKFIFSFLIASSLFVLAQGQDEFVFKRLHGTKVTKNIYIQWIEPLNDQPGKFEFKRDDDNNIDWVPMSEETLFNISNDKKNTIGIYFRFYNPMRTSISSTITEIDDPVYDAISQWVTNLPLVSPSQAANNSVSDKENKMFAAAGSIPARFSETIIMYEWVNEFLSKLNTAGFTGAGSVEYTQKYQALVKLLNDHFLNVDQFLFTKMTIAGESKSLNDWINISKTELFDCEADYDKFNTALSTAEGIEGRLQSFKEKAESSIEALKKILADDYDKTLKSFIISSEQENFKNYSKAASIWILLHTTERIKINNSLLEKYTVAIKKMREFTNGFKAPLQGYRLESRPSFTWKNTKMKKYSYEGARLDKEGSIVAKSKVNGEFLVAKDQRLVPFVSMGVFYTDFEYPNYAIKEVNGVNTVGEGEKDRVGIRPAAYLNFLIKTKGDIFYPFIQLGISTGINDVLFPVGIGASIRNNFSISAGPIFGQRKELTTLKVGDPVKDDESLKKDLEYKGFVSYYFSVNYNFVKNK